MMNVMKRAWEIAREAEKESGYKAIEFIAEALRMAWKEAKEMTGEEIFKAAIKHAQDKEKECEKTVAKRTVVDGKPVYVCIGEERKALKKEWGVWGVIAEQLKANAADGNYKWFEKNAESVTPAALDAMVAGIC